jgi:DNA helicase-2/ATP-dependent DNA helicase PcrA
LINNISDETALRRIINTPARGISNRTVDQLLNEATERAEGLWDMLRTAASLPGIPQKAHAACARFVGQVYQWRELVDQLSPADLTRKVIEQLDYRGSLVKTSDTESEFESRWDTVEELVNAVATYDMTDSQPTIGGFLEEIATGAGEAEREKENQRKRNSVILMTLHAAKGLEYPLVYMVGMEEGVLPHHRSLDDDVAIGEERRLAYVGVTRAEEQLTLSMALTRMRWGRPYESLPSRFLFEMTGIEDDSASDEAASGSKKKS